MSSVTVQLKHPVALGSETIEELILKPNMRLFKDVSLEIGNGTMKFNPYALACVGVQLAGRPAATALVDKMHPSDAMEVAQAVIGFLSPAQTTGSEPSP